MVLGAIVHQQGKRIEALEAQQAVNLDSIEWVDQRVDGMEARQDAVPAVFEERQILASSK